MILLGSNAAVEAGAAAGRADVALRAETRARRVSFMVEGVAWVRLGSWLVGLWCESWLLLLMLWRLVVLERSGRLDWCDVDGCSYRRLQCVQSILN